METVKFEQFGLDKKRAIEITKDLPAISKERDILSVRYSEIIKMDINDPETAIKARELRILIKNNRTKGFENWHKVNKEFFLRGGQFVDALKNKEVAENKRMEEALESIEKHQERLEAERLAKLNKERIDLVYPYLEDVTGLNLSGMEEDVFDAYLTAKKTAYESKIESERKAEEERIESERKEKLHQTRLFKTSRLADFIPEYDSIDFSEMEDSDFISVVNNAVEKRNKYENEQEIIRIDNERLKAEAEALQAKIDKENKEREEKEKIESEKRAKEEAEKQAELEKIKIELEAEKRKELERIAKEKAEKDAKEKAELELAKAGDMAIIRAWVDSMVIKPIGTERMKPESIAICNEIFEKFEKFKSWAKNKTK